MSEEKPMSEELDELRDIDLNELETVTIKEVRESRPQIFGETPFDFILGDLGKAKVRRNIKTRVGSGDMYILDTNPMIYTFSNGYDQLYRFVEENKLKPNAKIRYVRNYIPEGKDSFATTYEFEKV